MIVNEIFRSIQGESTYSGRPCIFIRITGCNLRCTYCDSKYAYKEGKKMSISSIASEVRTLYKKGDIIEITGGEPMLQEKEIRQLLPKLDVFCKTILIETNGSVLLRYKKDSRFLDSCIYIMDWKSPSSGMRDRMEAVNLERLSNDDEIKFVIETDDDYEDMKEVIEKYDIEAKILVSTVWGADRAKIVERILEDGLKVIFQIQIHKIIWDKNKRGV